LLEKQRSADSICPNSTYRLHSPINSTNQERYNRILEKIKLLHRLPGVDRVKKASIYFHLAKRLEKFRRLLEPLENKTLTEILKENLAKDDGENTDWIDDLVAKVQGWFDNFCRRQKFWLQMCGRQRKMVLVYENDCLF